MLVMLGTKRSNWPSALKRTNMLLLARFVQHAFQACLCNSSRYGGSTERTCGTQIMQEMVISRSAYPCAAKH
jgi:hypothetical protein